MPDWEIAVEKQMAAWAFYNSEKGDAFLRGFRQAQREEDDPLLRHLNHNVLSTLWNADPIYVSDEMMTLLEHAYPEFEAEIMREEEVFIPFGFVYLPRPMRIQDWRGRWVGHRAIAWLPAKRDEDGAPAVYVTTFSEPEDVREDDRLTADETSAWTSKNFDKMRRFFEGNLVLNYASPMMYGMTIQEMLERAVIKNEHVKELYETNEAEITHATSNLLRFLQTLWRLLGQRVAVGMQAQPSRGYRRRAERAQFPEKYVTVITLRRPKSESGVPARSVEWSHRWLVSGHWRWQPYGDGTHRQIWISPYIKGPDDAPLVIRGARVFKWAR